jgi:protein SCO1/2
MIDLFLYICGVFLVLTPFVAWAQEVPPDQPPDVGLNQRLDAQVPPDLMFRDEQGQPVGLGRHFDGQPVILTLGYYECPMLCSLVRRGLFDSLQALSFNAGEQFQVISVSIDPREDAHTAAIHKAMYLQLSIAA